MEKTLKCQQLVQLNIAVELFIRSGLVVCTYKPYRQSFLDWNRKYRQWIKQIKCLLFVGSEPTVADKVVSRKVCVNSGNTCRCDKFYNIHIRNCSTYLVYNLTSTTSCPERYCFGMFKTFKSIQLMSKSVFTFISIFVELDYYTTDQNM